MKKTQKLEANRNIKDQLSSFISIVVIAMLAVTVYLGIAFSARAMDVNISGYYNRLNMQDLVVYSPLLMTGDDAEAIRAVDGVAEVEGGNETVAWLPTDSGVISVSVITMAERVAVPEIISGHAPQNRQECMIENLLAKTGYRSRVDLAVNARVLGLVVHEKERTHDQPPADGAD